MQDSVFIHVAGKAAAVEFDRPLLLTPGQDMRGYVRSVLGRTFLLAVTCSSVLAVLLILVFIVKEAWPFFRTAHGWQLFAEVGWHPKSSPPVFGGPSLLVGSLYVTLVAMLIAVPIGLLAALFLSDICSFKVRQVVKPIIEVLAAIPSVAYGFFAILVLAPWMQEHLGFSTGANILNASLLLAVMAIPTIVSISEDSLTALGRELREGAYALGATRAEALTKVVIPAAHSGIIAAVILGIMRAIGETMVVWMAAGNAAQIPSPWWNLSQSVRTLTATIAGDMGETEHGSTHYHALFAVGVLLLAITLVLNLVSEYFMNQLKKNRGGGRR